MTLHEFLDTQYGPDGDEKLATLLREGADPEERAGELTETALHVAARRRRLTAVKTLVDHGVDVDAKDAAGKTAYVHCLRRGFDEVAECLVGAGASAELGPADEFAIAVATNDMSAARALLASHPGIARTGNPEEDRLLADIAGRAGHASRMSFLIDAGADLAATGMDGGTALHQACWFAQLENATLLVEAGSPLDMFCSVNRASPIGWLAHGSRHAGGAAEAQDVYVGLAKLLLTAGCSLDYPGDGGMGSFFDWLVKESSPEVSAVIKGQGPS